MNNSQKAKNTVYIGIFALAMTQIGNVIGVAFSTGREVMTYFGNFGIYGYLGIIIAFSLLGIFSHISFTTARNMDKYTFDWLVSPHGWKPLRIFFLWFTLIGLFSSVSAMIAGTGSILQALFGVPYVVGAALMGIACAVTAFLKIEKLTDTLSIMVPIMVVLAIVICVICSISPVVNDSGWQSVSSDNSLLGNWFLSALIYFGFNVGPVRSLMAPMAKQIKDKKTSLIASVICSIVLMLVAACAMTAIVKNYSICSTEDLPTVTMAYYKHNIFGILYGVVAIIAIYSTCAAFLHIFKASFVNIPALKKSTAKLNLSLTLLVAVGFAVSFIGFSNFVDRVWAVLGYSAYIGIVIHIYNYFYYKKHPQNRETAVDNPELAVENPESEA